MLLVHKIKSNVTNKDFKEGLIDLIFKEAKNKNHVGNNPYIQYPNNNKVYLNSYSFYGCYDIRGIIIPDSIKHINIFCFEGCIKLKYIYLSKSLLTLETGCFGLCLSLKSVKIPESLSCLGRGSFYLCKSLKNIILPKSIVYIYSNFELYSKFVFNKCQLESITVPENLRHRINDIINFEDNKKIKVNYIL